MLARLGLLMFGASLGVSCTPAQSNSMLVLSGSTDGKMFQHLDAAIRRGERNFVINSRGGREADALTIAELIEKYPINLIVDGACTSACSQYLLVAAQSVEVRSDSLIAFHLNSVGLLNLKGLKRESIPNLQELISNRIRGLALYERRRVDTKLLLDATAAMQPKCVDYGDNSSRLVTSRDLWVPSVHYLRSVNISISGFWPSNYNEASSVVGKHSKPGVRFSYGEPPVRVDNSTGPAEQCTARP